MANIHDPRRVCSASQASTSALKPGRAEGPIRREWFKLHPSRASIPRPFHGDSLMRPLMILALTAVALTGCRKAQRPGTQTAMAPASPVATDPSNNISGKLLERIDAAPYSYLRIQSAGGEVWAAVPETKVEKGAEVTVFNAMQMNNFESKTLKRTFEVVYFGTTEAPTSAGAAVPAGHPTGAEGPMDAPDVKVEKAKGADAHTISEVHAQKASLKEKPVSVRGKVVKFNAEVMGKNWLHLRDGSGSAEAKNNDLTVTTKDTVKVGDVVQVKGVVRVDKDFGSGYTYPVIVEEAKVSK